MLRRFLTGSRIIFLPFLAALFLLPHAQAKDIWRKVESENFTVVGNSSERNLLRVASRLEKFRHAFVILFPNYEFNSSVPTRVLVYRDERSFRPVAPRRNGKPVKNLAGYFRRGETANYIVIHSPGAARQNDFLDRLIFHEYTHFLIRNMLQTTPAWLSEGLAEYFSTFQTRERGKKAYLGWPIEDHIRLLREGRLLPLRVLLRVDHSSPYYNERDKKGIFYAQSWALVHYLIEGELGLRRRLLPRLAALLASGTLPEQALIEALEMDFVTLEKALRRYVENRVSYPARLITFSNRLQFETNTESFLLSEADAQYFQGALLANGRRERYPDAETFLQKAIRLDPEHSASHAALGRLRTRQGRLAEAKQHLERAVRAKSPGTLAHYYYAWVHSIEELKRNPNGGVSFLYRNTYPPELRERLRKELQEAIRLAPRFADSHFLLGRMELQADGDLDSAVVHLTRAWLLEPGRNRYTFTLAGAYMRKRDPKSARALLKPLAQAGDSPEIRERARKTLETLDRYFPPEE